jgi:flagellar hook-associated protein 1 FlgK
MAGLFGELQRTAQALNAQSVGVFTTGRNMANVNNPNYARQRVVLGDRGTVMGPMGPQSLGVEALGLQAVRDRLLDSQVVRETSLMSELQAESDAYDKAQIALGQQIDSSNSASFVDGATNTDGSHGIGEALDSLLNAFSSLASDPRSTSERQTLLQQAQTLVDRFHTVDGRLGAIQDDIDTQIGADVTKVNDLLQSISELNQQIGRFEIGKPGSALDLRDSRQAKLEELAQYMNFDVQEVSTTPGQIQILTQDAGGNPVMLLDKSETPETFAFNGTSFTVGAPPVAVALTSGSLAGNLTARDGAVADVRTGLDALAKQLVSAVNTAYNPGGTSTNFFDPAGVSSATIALDGTLNVSSIRSTNTANPGANEIALAVANLATKSFSTGSGDAIDGTLGGHYRSVVSDVANAASSASSRYDDQATLQRLMKERRDSVSGVSLDEEMTDLVKYQRAFEASARIMKAIEEMMDVVVNQLVQ